MKNHLYQEMQFVCRSFDLNLTEAAARTALGHRPGLKERLSALLPTGEEALAPAAVAEIRAIFPNPDTVRDFREAFRIAMRRAKGLITELEHDAPDALPDVIRLQNEAELFVRAADFALADA